MHFCSLHAYFTTICASDGSSCVQFILYVWPESVSRFSVYASACFLLLWLFNECNLLYDAIHLFWQLRATFCVRRLTIYYCICQALLVHCRCSWHQSVSADVFPAFHGNWLLPPGVWKSFWCLLDWSHNCLTLMCLLESSCPMLLVSQASVWLHYV